MNARNRSATVIAVAVIVIVLAAALNPPALATDGSNLVVTDSLQLTGAVTSQAPGAGFHITGAQPLERLFLHAEETRVEMAWERGLHIGENAEVAERVTDRGARTSVLRSATFSFAQDQGPALAFLEPGATHALQIEGPSASQLALENDRTVVAVGTSPDALRAGQPAEHGYWYTIDEPVLFHERDGLATVTGSFTLFVHNVTIQAQTEGGQSWTTWTGYRATDPDQPVTEYEERITTLQVTNGTLSVDTGPGSQSFAPQLDLTVEGVVSASSATGELETGEGLYRYDHTPLRWDGRVALTATASTSGAQDGGGQDLIPGPQIDLTVAPGTAFRVADTRGLQAMPTPPPDPWLPIPAWTLGLFGAGILALGAVALTHDPSRMLAIPGLRELAQRRHEHWMKEGWAALVNLHPAHAATCFQNAVRLQPEDPLAWYQWAISEHEAGNSRRCLELLEQAETISGMDRLDLLEARAAAAHHAGDHPLFEASIAELATTAPGMARSLLEDMGLDPDQVPDPPVDQIEPSGAGGYNDGYV